MNKYINKELYTKEYDSKIITGLNIDREHLTFKFEEDEITFSSYHDQDCCEDVYADFSVIKYHEEELIGKKLQKIVVKGVDDMGFLLCFYFNVSSYGISETEKIFIPCHNEQNGYYSDELSLKIKHGHGELHSEINISNFVEDRIY